jgi:hypothetical protein
MSSKPNLQTITMPFFLGILKEVQLPKVRFVVSVIVWKVPWLTPDKLRPSSSLVLLDLVIDGRGGG